MPSGIYIYIKCNLSKLEVRRNVHLRNFMFKQKKKECNVVDNSEVTINTRLHDGPVFKVTHPNSEPIKRSVMYSGALEWNNLDADLRNIDDIKRKQKFWMLETFSE